MIALSRRLVEEFGGEVPRDRAILETLPGVGRKTAPVLAGYGLRTAADLRDASRERLRSLGGVSLVRIADELAGTARA